MNREMTYQGSCHCRAVTFEVQAPENIVADRCNCSICSKCGYLHLIVPLEKFRQFSGADMLTSYRFNTGLAEHTFCKACGVKPFYKPRSNPDGMAVNVNCLDTPAKSISIVDFDGRNWEQNAHTLAHKSKMT